MLSKPGLHSASPPSPVVAPMYAQAVSKYLKSRAVVDRSSK